MDFISLQDQYAPSSTCFGCGPANQLGLRIRSRPLEDSDGLIAHWRARPEHQAFANALNGGIIATLLDCHSNWTAAMYLMAASGNDRPPSTVTADLAVRYLRPAPTADAVTLRAHVVEATERRASVDATLEAEGQVCATSHATFVVVNPGHPAYGRW